MSRPLPEHQVAARERAKASGRLVLKGVLLNAVLAVAKATGGILGNTYALIADAIESLLDICTSLLVWGGFQWAAQPPDDEHPYGHGKAEAVAALCVAALILGAAAWIGWHAVHEILVPHHGPHWATLLLLVIVIAVKVVFSRRLARAGEAMGSTALGAEATHHWADAITSGAAFIGIAIGVLGGPGYETADDWAALVACGVIVFNGVHVLRTALGDIMDVAAPLSSEVRDVARAVPGVVDLHECRVRKSGVSYLVDLHVRVDPDISVRAGHDIAHAVKDSLIASPLKIADVLVHIEPAEGRRAKG